MKKRKLCVVTGSRAEYGLLRGLLDEIKSDPQLKLQLVVTGAHLSGELGLTHKAVEKDGFRIDEKVRIPLRDNTPAGVTRSLGFCVAKFAGVLKRLRPDILVVLGDRYEIFAACQAALVARVPIAHIHGGESTEGAVDEAIRHSITKMSHLHFTAAPVFKNTVIQLGEDPRRVFDFGAPGLEAIRKLRLLEKRKLEKELRVAWPSPRFLITYHPATLAEKKPADAARELLKALRAFPEAGILFTKANADAHGKAVNRLIDGYVKLRPRAAAFASMGQRRYLSALKHADVVIGNSSSGLIEAPALKTPTVNIGDRQRGRLKAASVIDCRENERSIRRAIRKALSAGFRKKVSTVRSLYRRGDVSRKIKEVLKRAPLEGILMKRFHRP